MPQIVHRAVARSALARADIEKDRDEPDEHSNQQGLSTGWRLNNAVSGPVAVWLAKTDDGGGGRIIWLSLEDFPHRGDLQIGECLNGGSRKTPDDRPGGGRDRRPDAPSS